MSPEILELCLPHFYYNQLFTHSTRVLLSFNKLHELNVYTYLSHFTDYSKKLAQQSFLHDIFMSLYTSKMGQADKQWHQN